MLNRKVRAKNPQLLIAEDRYVQVKKQKTSHRMKISEIKKINPWKELTEKVESNYFQLIPNNSLDADKKVIENFNQKQSELYELKTSMMPAHFTGNILKSKIVLLATNPGYVEREVENFYSNPKFIKERILDLSFSRDSFISDDKERIKESPYWNQKLRWLIEETNFQNVSKNIALLQFNPYHSIKFREIAKKYFKNTNSTEYLDSQKYGFILLKYCIEQDKLIVILRSKKAWLKAVPELSEYEKKGNVITIKNKRQPFISPNNFESKNGFNKLVNKLIV